MAIVRWEPTREVDGNGAGTGRTRRWVPAMDLVETEDHLVLRADLPGLSEDDVEIEIKDGVLTVSGEREAEHEEKSEGFYRVERAFGLDPNAFSTHGLPFATPNGGAAITFCRPASTADRLR